MAHLLRGKQAGVQNDFSVDIEPDHFCIDDVSEWGIHGVQSFKNFRYDPNIRYVHLE